MIAKSTDPNRMESHKRLPLLLLISLVQDSTKYSQSFSVYGCDPRLPTGALLEQSLATNPVDMEDYQTELLTTLKKTRQSARESIQKVQEKQHGFYERQSVTPKFQVGDRVMVFMHSETVGKNRKLVTLPWTLPCDQYHSN